MRPHEECWAWTVYDAPIPYKVRGACDCRMCRTKRPTEDERAAQNEQSGGSGSAPSSARPR